MRRLLSGALALTLVAVAWTANADSVAGLCPDGSAFIVRRRADAPCDRAKFVDDPSDMPPLRPELLPRPYTWQLDHQARDPNNPYNLLDQAEQVRAAQDPPPGEAAPSGPSQASAATTSC